MDILELGKKLTDLTRNVQTGFRVHSNSYSVRTSGYFPEYKAVDE